MKIEGSQGKQGPPVKNSLAGQVANSTLPPDKQPSKETLKENFLANQQIAASGDGEAREKRVWKGRDAERDVDRDERGSLRGDRDTLRKETDSLREGLELEPEGRDAERGEGASVREKQEPGRGKRRNPIRGGVSSKDDPLAVALRYDRGRENAPRVIAGGRGHLARKILEVAEAESVPIYSDPSLVKVLDGLELGSEIPEELYPVVAEVLAFVYRLDRKMKPALR